MLTFGFWIFLSFLVKPVYCKKAIFDRLWDFHGFSVIRMSTAVKIHSMTNKYTILLFYWLLVLVKNNLNFCKCPNHNLINHNIIFYY